MESMPIPLFDNALEDGGNEDIKAQLQISVAYFCSIGLYFLV